jgi:hypothetical protein
MSSLPPLVLAVLLGASSAAWAADQAARNRQADLFVPPVVDLDHGLGADLAPEASGSTEPETIPLTRDLDDRLDGLKGPGGERNQSPLEVRLGRTPAVGRSPGEAPPFYGEVGIDLGSVAGLSLVPSYRLVLPNDAAEESEASAAQILKLGARITF